MILVCGGVADSVTELVCARLTDCQYPYRLLDLGFYPSGYQMSWKWTASGPEGYLYTRDWKLNLSEITGIYIRYLGVEGRLSPKVAADAVPAMYHEYDMGLMALFEDLPCLVVNRVEGGMSNCSKVYQALLVRQCGLLTPPTLVTNKPDAALRFYDECQGEVIYKSLSGVRSIVRHLRTEQFSRLALLRDGPAQFQSYIPGEDIRVHTVGERVFACRIRSAAVDYRYATRDGLEVTMERASLPHAVSEACLKLSRELTLELAGLDLKETPQGDYYCFEVNPSPGFIYFEKHSRQPISLALADLLHHGRAAQRQLSGVGTTY
jgi:glutathione synthase/RimK-type ligase-like ATP-grasp enzyme